MPSIRREASRTDSPEPGARMSEASRLQAARQRRPREGTALMLFSAALNRRPESSGSLVFLGTADLRETAGSLADREAEGADETLSTYTPVQHRTEVAVEDMCHCVCNAKGRTDLLIYRDTNVAFEGNTRTRMVEDTKQGAKADSVPISNYLI